MTSKTPTDKQTAEGSRLAELMRADAAAVMDDDLDDATSIPKTHGTAEGSARLPSQVYSIRVPVERLEQVRSLANARGLAPTAMMRQWVLARLDDEMAESPDDHRNATATLRETPSRPDERALVTHLEAVASALAEAATQMMKTLSTLAEVAATQRAGDLRPQIASAAQGPFQIMPLAAAAAGFNMPWVSQAPVGTFGMMPVPAAFPYAAGSIGTRYVYQGLAALQSTVRAASAWPGVSDYALDDLYTTADEVLTGP